MSDQIDNATSNEEGSALSFTGEQTRRDFLKKAGLGTAAAAAVWMVPQVTSVGARRAYAASTGPCIPRTIDFEGFAKGTLITTQIPGMTVSSTGGFGAMIFDTANPTGGDSDLVTPGGGTNNNTALGKVLIISEDGDAGDPDDDAGGGTIKFVFDNPASISTVKVLDIESSESALIEVFSDQACTTKIKDASASGLGNNSVENVNVNALGGNVLAMKVTFASSGAVAEFVCPCPTVTFN